MVICIFDNARKSVDKNISQFTQEQCKIFKYKLIRVIFQRLDFFIEYSNDKIERKLVDTIDLKY